jgi:hypothetical protein
MVSYPLATVLDRIDGKLSTISGKLDTKADRADVSALADRVIKLETAEAQRGTAAAVAAERVDWRKWALPTLLTAIYTVVAVIQFLHP